MSEFVQIPRRLRSPCWAGGRLKGEVTRATAPSSPQVSRHPIFSSAENVISGRGGRVGGGDHGRRQPQLSKPPHHSSFLQSKFNRQRSCFAFSETSLATTSTRAPSSQIKDLQWTKSQRLGGGRKSLHHSKRLHYSKRLHHSKD